MKVDLSSKLAQVIEQIPKDVLYDFCCSYAQEHEELATESTVRSWRTTGIQRVGWNTQRKRSTMWSWSGIVGL